ncbi:DM13 domain-containing protein [Vibrio ostreicida]|uniref:DM13 domain-containing protein n=1 Tax=Vibrio ostreicida TaxID=526588 RepID=A0ABT8BZ62_9VIBR|nr:DM13 domain-containing protein [Vibrio ostreicida]MDN3611363.1 DM13 domain-containing protein [Vibrio ostreicida]NPD09299.1 DM13 domain-containing protein [Vibrio ostreicida]
MKRLFLLISHLAFGAAGFALGVYALPILIQPESPAMIQVETVTNQAQFTATFQRDRQDSDFLHWGEGSVSLSPDQIAFVGELAPGPDYQLYLSPTFIETEGAFAQNRADMLRVGAVKTFDRFVVDLPSGTDLERYTTVIVWCETFGEFITSARFR